MQDQPWTKSGFHQPSKALDNGVSLDGRIGLVVALWNREITLELERGCRTVLSESGVRDDQIITLEVPGCFEIPVAASWLCALNQQKPQAVIALGCLIQGETPHFDLIAQSVNHGLMDLSLREGIPMINGVLTVLNAQQAHDRLGGEHGHKGKEAASTAIQMLTLKSNLT
ncbi:MAG: 6,7-dimethyl-8-ribityllumazine synthase [Bacteroidia bacterium]